MRTSYSALNVYKSCPLKYKYQEIDKIRAPKGKEAVFGASVHESLRFMFKKNPLFPTLNEIIDFFKNIWNDRSLKITDITGEEKKSLTAEGQEIIVSFYKKNQPWNFNIIDLESRFDFLIEDKINKERHIIAGVMDRIDKLAGGEYEIIDYKTASRMPSQDSVNKDLQMSIYHLGILNKWPQIDPDKIRLSLYFLKHNEKITTIRAKRDILETKNSILSIINEIAEKQSANNFPPTPSALCDWCGYRKMCPMWKYQYSDNKYKTPDADGIKEIIQEYLILKENEQKNKKRTVELQKLIHNFMDNEKVERVFGESAFITRKLKETLRYDLEKTREILEPIHKFKELLKIDETLLNKLIPKLPAETQNKFKEIAQEVKIVKTLAVSKIKK